jgi:hypothetical protein
MISPAVGQVGNLPNSHCPRVAELMASYQRAIYLRTDRWFASLLIFQWAAAVAMAYWVSPLAWEGTSSRTHPHVWMAIFLGAVVISLPLALIFWKPGQTVTRHTIGWDSNLAGKELTLTETAKLWDDLASEDAPAAYLAIWRLAAAGDKAVSFLKDELEPVKSTLAERLVKLTSELGAKDLATRAGAVSALERLGPAALPYLRKVLEESPPDRVRWRAERLIAKLDRPGEKYPPGGILHGESLRTLRTIQVLERNGTESARRVLADLATELEEVVETHQARASLMRLTRIH